MIIKLLERKSKQQRLINLIEKGLQSFLINNKLDRAKESMIKTKTDK